MKKLLTAAVLLALVVSLAACGETKTAEPEATAAPMVTEAPAEPETPAEATEAPAEDTLAETIALVQSLKGQEVSELYAAIGEPESSEYSSSCLVQGGQDGQLFYDGFTVYTLVSAEGAETVYDVE